MRLTIDLLTCPGRTAPPGSRTPRARAGGSCPRRDRGSAGDSRQTSSSARRRPRAAEERGAVSAPRLMRYLTLGEVVGSAPPPPPGRWWRSLASATWARSTPPSPNQRPRSMASTSIRPLLEKAAALCLLAGSEPPIRRRQQARRARRHRETFLVLNGSEIDAPVNDQERFMLDLAAGRIDRAEPLLGLASSPSQAAR